MLISTFDLPTTRFFASVYKIQVQVFPSYEPTAQLYQRWQSQSQSSSTSSSAPFHPTADLDTCAPYMCDSSDYVNRRGFCNASPVSYARFLRSWAQISPIGQLRSPPDCSDARLTRCEATGPFADPAALAFESSEILVSASHRLRGTRWLTTQRPTGAVQRRGVEDVRRGGISNGSGALPQLSAPNRWHHSP